MSAASSSRSTTGGAAKVGAAPLMPHATATWLVDNSSLSFAQIADFCQIHVLEVQAIADETALSKLTPRDPVRAGELSAEEIARGQADPAYRLRITQGPVQQRRTSGPRYTPLARRSEKPDGIAWVIKHHPEISDAQISKLIGTTKTTIAAIRNREHWNMANITAKDPVTLGLCSQRELDALVASVARQSGAADADSGRLDANRDAMIAELRAERDAQTADSSTRTEHTAETLFKTSH